MSHIAQVTYYKSDFSLHKEQAYVYNRRQV